jgi:hypothetical protein
MKMNGSVGGRQKKVSIFMLCFHAIVQFQSKYYFVINLWSLPCFLTKKFKEVFKLNDDYHTSGIKFMESILPNFVFLRFPIFAVKLECL